MTEYQISLTGLHARNEKTIQATQDWERGRIGNDVLAECFRADGDSIVALQNKVGVKYATDGQLTSAWQDLIRPISSGFDGLEPGPMFRWFNTNTFFFTPIVKGAISSDGKVLSKVIEKRFVNRASNFKIVIPDPLTFAELAEDRHYKNKDKLIFAYSDALNGELRSLSAAGVKYVQFSAPSLVYRLKQKPYSNASVKQLGEALRNALKGVSARSGFYPFFGDASPYLPDLFDAIPTDDIGVDLTQTDESLLGSTKKGIIAGIVDSRTTYLEDAAALASRIENAVDLTGTKTLTLAPSADLRFIPRVSADEKLLLLERIAKKVGKKTGNGKASAKKPSTERSKKK